MTQDGVGATILASSVQLTDFCEILNIANAGDHVIYFLQLSMEEYIIL